MRSCETFDEMKDVIITGNWERGTGVWELVYSGNALKNSKWRSKQRKRLAVGQYVLARAESD